MPESSYIKVPMPTIDEGFTKPRAIIAALMASGHATIALAASGRGWWDEADPMIQISPSDKRHAVRMEQIWAHAAKHLQAEE